MEKDTDILHEAKRLRLLAAALELQHFTRTASNIIPIPGGDRVIAIGTPAQVRGLLAAAPAVGCGGTGKYGDMPCLGCDACPRETVGAALLTRCAAGRDGECGHAQCPQLRDCEPRATGRHCPLDSEGGHHD